MALALLCLSVALIAATPIALDRLERQRARRRLLANLGAPRALEVAAIGDTVVLEGTLDGATRSLVTFFPYEYSLLERASPFARTFESAKPILLLDRTEGPAARVSLDGAQVVGGSVETSNRSRSDRARDFGVEAAGPVEFGQFRVARAGERVRVRGRLALAASSDAAQYRERSAEPMLVADGDGVTVVTLRPPRGVRPLTMLATAVLVLTGGVAFHVAFRMAPTVTETIVHESADPCGATIRAALARNDPFSVATEAERCPDRAAAGWVAFALGEFDKASDRFASSRVEPSLAVLQAHMFGGRSNLARSSLESWRASHDVHRPFDCIDAALAKRAGEPDLIERLRSGAVEPGACGILRDDYGLYAWRPQSEWGQLFLLERMPELANELRAPIPFAGVPPVALLNPNAPAHQQPHALTKKALDEYLAVVKSGPTTWTTHDLRIATAAANLAPPLVFFYVAIGERQRALAALEPIDRLAALLTPEERARFTAELTPTFGSAYADDEWTRYEEHRRYLFGMAAVAARHLGDSEREALYVERSLNDAAAIDALARLRSDTSGATFGRLSFDIWNQKLLASAQDGDGAQVVHALVGANSTGREVLARMKPRLRTNQNALAAWVRDRFPPPCLQCGVTAVAENLGDRRYAASLFGVTELEGALGVPARRYADAMTDRKNGLEWLLLERLVERR